MVKTYGQLYLDARRALLAVEEPNNAGLMARNLVCHATGKTQEQLLSQRDLYASEAMGSEVETLVARAVTGEPLAYILGKWEFYGLPLLVDRRVLIPRDDTCAVTSLAIKYGLFLGKSPRIMDLCTGSGCIGLAVASRITDARVTLADVSKDALAVAKSNIALNHMSGRAACYCVNAFEKPTPFLGKFDMIISNPPYITTQEMEELPSGVGDFEPHLALHGGTDGLDFYRAIVDNFTPILNPDGLVCFEFGMGQGDAVCGILEAKGYTILERTRDYNERERAVIARYGRKEEHYGD